MPKITNPALSEQLQELLRWRGAGELFLGTFISNLITIFLIVAAVVAFFFLVMGGIRFITSGGDKEATEQAKSQITKAIIGLILVFISYAVVKLVGALLGVNLVLINLEPLMLR